MRTTRFIGSDGLEGMDKDGELFCWFSLVLKELLGMLHQRSIVGGMLIMEAGIHFFGLSKDGKRLWV